MVKKQHTVLACVLALASTLSVAVALFLPPPSFGDTITLVSSRDATIYKDFPSNSDGAGQSMFIGTDKGPSPRRALIGFDIAGNVPAGSTITGVQLQLVLDAAKPGEAVMRPIQLRRLFADWGEGTTGRGTVGAGTGKGFATPRDGTTATWTHRFFNTMPWTNAGGDFSATASGTTMVGPVPMTYVWDSSAALVNDVQSWLDNPAGNFGWLLLGDEAAPGTARRFFTREALDAASRPTLAVAFTPPNAAASRLVVSVPPNVTAGSPFDIIVSAVDNGGNIAAGYTGTITFTTSDPYPGLVPADYTFTPSDQGTHTFSAAVTLFTMGSQTLTAQDTADGTLTGSAMLTVGSAPANRLLIAAPATAVSGTPFDVLLATLDPYGNVDTNYVGTVAWASTDTDPGVILPAAYTFQANDGGMHIFPGGITLITVGNQTLAVADTVSGITGSATITVGPGP